MARTGGIHKMSYAQLADLRNRIDQAMVEAEL